MWSLQQLQKTADTKLHLRHGKVFAQNHAVVSQSITQTKVSTLNNLSSQITGCFLKIAGRIQISICKISDTNDAASLSTNHHRSSKNDQVRLKIRQASRKPSALNLQTSAFKHLVPRLRALRGGFVKKPGPYQGNSPTLENMNIKETSR